MNKKQEQKIKILKMLNDNTSFDTFYSYLQEEDIGDWDSVNDDYIVKQYCSEMMEKGIHVAHIIEALETNKSNHDMYCIWLGNSMETPTPINTKEDLIEALEIELPKIKIDIKIQHKDAFPKGEWVTIANECYKGNDDLVYFYVDNNIDLSTLKKGDMIELDEEFLIVEVEE